MSSWKKTREKLLLGASDVNTDFEAVCVMLRHLGFLERHGGGSHRIFYKDGIEEIINLQSRGGQGKPYQMKQIRQILLRYKLSEE
jgi:predicted RNA binding protein YcfA (HicA-like mRNA interferase family)